MDSDSIHRDAYLEAVGSSGRFEIGDLAVLGARSSAYKDLEGGRIHVGNPARDVKERSLK